MQEVERLCDHVVVVADGRTVASGSVAGLLAQTGETDFEAAFVRLAYGGAGAEPGVGHVGCGASPDRAQGRCADVDA
jgi:sodium transport system ATP-binding protein